MTSRSQKGRAHSIVEPLLDAEGSGDLYTAVFSKKACHIGNKSNHGRGIKAITAEKSDSLQVCNASANISAALTQGPPAHPCSQTYHFAVPALYSSHPYTTRTIGLEQHGPGEGQPSPMRHLVRGLVTGGRR